MMLSEYATRAMALSQLFCMVIFVAAFAAAQPPPPTYYDLEVCFEGGDERCDIDINDDGWQSETYENSFIQGTFPVLRVSVIT